MLMSILLLYLNSECIATKMTDLLEISIMSLTEVVPKGAGRDPTI